MSALLARPAADASTIRPPRIACTCGCGDIDFERDFLGVQESGLDHVALVLANCAHCHTTRAVEVYSVVRAGALAGLK